MESFYPDQLIRRYRVTGVSFLLLLLACLTAQIANAQDGGERDNSDEPILIDAESSEFDYELDKLVFRGLRMDQGTLGIQADVAEAAKLDFESGSWTFSGNVIVESDEATLYCDYARFMVSDNELVEAELTGSPARFEQFIEESGKLNSGEAKRIYYRLDTDTIELSDDARFTDGTNEISSDLITYDLEEKHLTADSGDTGPVKILIEPPDKDSDSKEAP